MSLSVSSLALLRAPRLRGFRIAQRIEHRHLLLVQIVIDGIALLGNLVEQTTTGEPRLLEIWQGVVQTTGGLFVLSRNLGGELDGLGEDVVQLFGEVLGTSTHTVQEVGIA